MNITGEARIYKNDKGSYHTILTNKTIENGEEKRLFMNVNVAFRKGVDVKNKTKISIKEGFLTFYTIPEKTNSRFIKLMILDFEIVEDGVDTNMKSYETKQLEKENKNEFLQYDNPLPF